MNQQTETRLMRVWLVLSGITLLTWWLGSEHDQTGAHNGLVTYAALVIVAIKVRVIVSEFMEARHFSALVQRAMDAWLLLLIGGLSAIYALELGMPAV